MGVGHRNTGDHMADTAECCCVFWWRSYSIVSDRTRRTSFHAVVEHGTLGIMKINPSTTDDVCQQVLAKLWQELKNFQPDEKRARFRTWFTKLIRNVAIDDYRKRRRANRVSGVSSDAVYLLTGDSSDLEQKIETEWEKHVVTVAMGRIRRIFSGKAVEVHADPVDFVRHSLPDLHQIANAKTAQLE